jgi:hypothetical protein
MKSILEFNLPEEAEDLQLALNGSKYMSAVHELDQELRSKIKYAPDNQPELVTETYNEIRNKLWEIVNSYGLEL